jgi:hypothetical protein
LRERATAPELQIRRDLARDPFVALKIAVTLRSFLAAGHCTGGRFVPDLLGNRGGGGFDDSKSSRQNWRQFLPNCQARLAKF